jgi:hypothetical protein
MNMYICVHVYVCIYMYIRIPVNLSLCVHKKYIYSYILVYYCRTRPEGEGQEEGHL